MSLRSCAAILVIAAGLSAISAAQAGEVTNGLTSNGLTSNGLSANGQDVQGRLRNLSSDTIQPRSAILQDGETISLR